MSSSRHLYLVRHGATDANSRQPYVLQGRRTDLPLNEIGRRQAEAARRAFESLAIDHLFSSPLRRALQTAEVLAEPHGVQVSQVDDLTECDVGRWEGLSWDDVRRQDGPYLDAFESDPGAVPYADGESFQQVQDRAVPAIRRLIREHPVGNLVVVTHNVVARVIVAQWTGTAIAKARTIRLDNAGITIVSIADEKENLVTLNSVLHLAGLLENF
jgi:broad specificity phosphatase PhoE